MRNRLISFVTSPQPSPCLKGRGASGIILGSKCFFWVALIFISGFAHAKSLVRQQILFGNVPVTIEINSTLSREAAFEWIQVGFNLAQKLEKKFSTYQKNSELNRVNRASKPLWQYPLSPELYTLMESALLMTQKTEFYFDLTWRMKKSAASKIKLKGQKISSPVKDLIVDPTGLAKGFIVDQVVEQLMQNKNVHSVFVAASGDMRFATKSTAKKLVRIFNPLDSKKIKLPSARLHNQAISTSGLYERGRHIKNTQASPVEHLQTSVIAPNATTSDGLATAFLFMPLDKIKEVLHAFPGATAIVLEQTGEILEL